VGGFVGVFDSGKGGLTVLTSCKTLLPDEKFLYFADTANAPYGNKSDEYIKDRVFAISQMFVDRGAKAIVVACNTATNVGIKELRQHFKIPFVGLEPAIKPAIEQCASGKIILLCTKATARQDKLKDLLARHSSGNIEVVALETLATLIENNFRNLESIRGDVYSILSKHQDVCGVILGCTHYIHIKNIITDFYSNNNVKVFDGNDGAARRLKQLLAAQKGTGTLDL